MGEATFPPAPTGARLYRESASPGAVTLSLFAAAVVIGGINFLAVRFSNEGLDPFWGAGLRFAIAASILVLAALLMRLTWPRGRLLLQTALYGFFSFTLSYALMYWALVEVTASMAAVVLATVPLVTPLLAASQKLEPLNGRLVAGAVVALGGMVLMTVGPEGLLLPLSGLVAILAAALTIGQSAILSKRVAGSHPVMTNAVGMAVGAPLLLVISLMAGESWVVPTGGRPLWALVYLSTLGSVGLFVAFLLVFRRWTASAT
ncbi:MAG: EamA family transporter, partial [Acidimicrobiia bacterium]|nr:EamA family transporter [Acidimicrobiia bacterium]